MSAPVPAGYGWNVHDTGSPLPSAAGGAGSLTLTGRARPRAVRAGRALSQRLRAEPERRRRGRHDGHEHEVAPVEPAGLYGLVARLLGLALHLTQRVELVIKTHELIPQGLKA